MLMSGFSLQRPLGPAFSLPRRAHLRTLGALRSSGSSRSIWTQPVPPVMLLTSLLMGNGCLNSPHPGSTEQQLINADKTTSSQPSYYWVKMAAVVTEGHEATFPWKVTSPLIWVWRHITAASDPETVPLSQSPFPAVLKPRLWSQSCRVSKT